VWEIKFHARKKKNKRWKWYFICYFILFIYILCILMFKFLERRR
jgi:uncharacterized protein YpmS